MPQYTSTTTTSSGLVVNAVLDTESGQTTYTVTTPSGASATKTVPNGTPPNSSSLLSTENLTGVGDGKSGLFAQLSAAGATDIGSPSAATNAVSSVTSDVTTQSTVARTAAEASGNPPPDNPTPATPVTPADDPNATPAPSTPSIENAAPAPTTAQTNASIISTITGGTATSTTVDTNTVIDDGSDPFVSNGESTISALDTNTVIDDGSDPYVSNGQSTISSPDTNTVIDDRSDPYVSNGQSTIPPITSTSPSSSNAIGVVKAITRSTATSQDSASFQKAKDWRVRISLAPNSNYLYNAPDPGILAPLNAKNGTNGVIFPYTPNISVAYAAGYDATDIAHSNYKVFQYKGSSVDSISITGDFTAQDTNEANYLLAVIHFFRSVTKMFYGQDNNPKPGVPPPLCYLSGFGTYQFDNHPMAITNFTYTTPTDVDYIRAGSQTNMPGQSTSQQPSLLNSIATAASAVRLLTSNLTAKTPNFQRQNAAINSDATYVPTKISIAITAIPVVSRNDISNTFSLEKYATGQLLQGSKRNGGGIW